MNIKERVLKCVSESAGVFLEDVTPESTVTELGMDSLDQVELIMELEDEFGISIPDLDCGDWITVSEIITYVEEHK